MFLVERVYQVFPDMDPNRALYDQTGKLWSKAWLALTDSYPSMSGENIENVLNHSMGVHDDDDDDDDDAGMDGQNTACLFVANHASWLDIPVLCTVLDPVFKFIAKGELSNVPCIGQQLTGVRIIMMMMMMMMMFLYVI
jgi:1-acyl-sn-glycerol-3-phosphate acyltransferase